MQANAIKRRTLRHLLLQYVAAVNEHRDSDARRLFNRLWRRA